MDSGLVLFPRDPPRYRYKLSRKIDVLKIYSDNADQKCGVTALDSDRRGRMILEANTGDLAFRQDRGKNG